MTAISPFTASRRRALGPMLALGALAGAVAAAAAYRAGSVAKPRLAHALASLPKNAPAVVHGIRAVATSDVEGGAVVHVLHVPGAGDRREKRPSPAVVLLHDTPGCLFEWVEVIDGGDDAAGHAFAGLAGRGFPVFALELPGHGLTPAGEGPVSFAAAARTTAAALAALDLRGVFLVGAGLGGEVAWRAALLAPERVARLVLLAPTGLRGDQRTAAAASATAAAAAGTGVATYLAASMARPPRPDEVLEARLVRRNRDDLEMAAALFAELGAAERAAGNERLSPPAVVLWGELDRVAPPDVWLPRYAAALKAGSRTVARAGHRLHVEAPAAVVAELVALRDG